MKRRRIVLLSLCAVAGTAPAGAATAPNEFAGGMAKSEQTNAAPRQKLILPSLFSHRMVLQAGVPLRIWGWATPGRTVRVEFGGRSAVCRVGTDGTWAVQLDPLAACAEPRSMTIAVDDGETRVINDVLVGEVWLCAGQSNMYMPVCRTLKMPEDDEPVPGLRLFRVDYDATPDWREPQRDVRAGWSVAADYAIQYFSAVAFHFGKTLRRELDLPVGLIACTCGDTMAENWTSMETLRANPLNREYLATYEAQAAEWDPAAAEATNAARLAQWEAAAAAARAAGKPVPPKPSLVRPPWTSYVWPARLYNGMIAPLIPFAIRGVIWYQGEANHRRVETYGVMLQDLIRSWREAWGQGDFPFLFVQLPNSNIGTWPRLRQLQAEALRLPNTGMVVALDVGDYKDIHPRNKRPVGHRLARLALHQVYGRDVPCYSPQAVRAVRKGSHVWVEFEHTYGGLLTGTLAPPPTNAPETEEEQALPGVPGARVREQPEAAPLGFELAGKGGQFVPATARLAGEGVEVWNDTLPEPARVRYAWAPNPPCNLYNRAGLPAAPFDLAVEVAEEKPSSEQDPP